MRTGLTAKCGSARRSCPTSGAPVVVQVHGIQQRDAVALLVELAHVQQFLVRIAAAAGAQDPGAHGQGFHLFGGYDARSGVRACGYR
jgi:hypothetical protein